MDSVNDSLGASSDPKTAIVRQIQQEAAINNARQLIDKMNNHCFQKCVPTPGSSLSRKEEGCLTQCMEKYMATWNTVSRQYIARIQKSSNLGGVGGDEGFGI
ncbi:hypothetical protein OEA41_008303 [Lepraria neglecta]|uniref:Mitochondrial import inner membrane translocase subunit n=1 Tax=Lepraria neglecta TaxID=209136 RepID=A0AAD9ZEG2_9LECA|nr:hypothetical protein OEA41_008303 [Lepraria neglecta]